MGDPCLSSRSAQEVAAPPWSRIATRAVGPREERRALSMGRRESCMRRYQGAQGPGHSNRTVLIFFRALVALKTSSLTYSTSKMRGVGRAKVGELTPVEAADDLRDRPRIRSTKSMESFEGAGLANPCHGAHSPHFCPLVRARNSIGSQDCHSCFGSLVDIILMAG